MPLETIVSRCREVGIDCIAVCDHGTAEGALRMREIAPFPVIVAEEILTPHGEIMGMFLRETIPSRLPVKEVVARIKDQGGLVCIPHPFDRLRPSALRRSTIEEIVGQIDVIEVLNARTILPRHPDSLIAFARKYGIAMSAGSDAHTPMEIGHAYVEIPEFAGRDDFLTALNQGRISGHLTSPFVHFATTWARLKEKARLG